MSGAWETCEEQVAHLRQIAGNDQPLFFILGPCSMESEQHVMMMAERLVTLAQQLGFRLIFKTSFDKANRISIKGYRSLGMAEGLEILARVRTQFNVPVVTDIHEPWQVSEVAEVVDVLQIPAMLCRQTDLLVAAAQSHKIVFIKKGQSLPPAAMEHLIEKVVVSGNPHVWQGERGFAFGYNDLIVDFRNFPLLKSFNKPVIFDVTHAVMQMGGRGSSSSGDRRQVADLAISGVAQGIAGVFLEVHEEPERAPVDGPNMVRLSHLHDLVAYLMELDDWVKQRPLALPLMRRTSRPQLF